MLKKSQTGFALHTILIALAAVAGVIVIGLFTKNQIAIQTEHKQFLATQKEVNDLGTKLAKATNPDKQEAVAYCDYGHVKYGKGGRTCWVKYRLLYINSDEYDAKELFIRLSTLLPQSTQIVDTSETYKDSKAMKFYSSSLKKNCLAELDTSEIANSRMELILSCSGEAKAEHFPVKD